jgi:hypothetical protein
LSTQALKQARRFRNVADSYLYRDGTLGKTQATYRNVAARLGQDTRDDFDGRALAGAIGTQQPDDFTSVQTEGD